MYGDDPFDNAAEPPSAEGPTTNETDRAAKEQKKKEDIGAAYKKYLGRDITESEYGNWMNTDNFEEGIKGSAEAKTYAQKQAAAAAAKPGGAAQPPGTPSGVNLDRGYLESQIRDAFKQRGNNNPTQQEIDYWVGKASTPDTYSDGKIRIGWNNYWRERLISGRSSADPRLAGEEGVIGTAPSGGGGGGGGEGGGSGMSPEAQSQRDQLFQTLMDRSKQSLNVNPKDPTIAANVNAFRAEQARGNQAALRQAAEGGGPMGNLNMERRMGAEKAAQATGGMQSQLMLNEMSARRTEIQNALTQMGNMLSDEQRNALQRELGLLDAAVKREQLAAQQAQNEALLNFERFKYQDTTNYNRAGGGTGS